MQGVEHGSQPCSLGLNQPFAAAVQVCITVVLFTPITSTLHLTSQYLVQLYTEMLFRQNPIYLPYYSMYLPTLPINYTLLVVHSTYFI